MLRSMRKRMPTSRYLTLNLNRIPPTWLGTVTLVVLVALIGQSEVAGVVGVYRNGDLFFNSAFSPLFAGAKTRWIDWHWRLGSLKSEFLIEVELSQEEKRRKKQLCLKVEGLHPNFKFLAHFLSSWCPPDMDSSFQFHLPYISLVKL